MSHTEQNVSIPSQAHRREFGGRFPSHEFFYLQTAKDWADKSIGEPQTLTHNTFTAGGEPL